MKYLAAIVACLTLCLLTLPAPAEDPDPSERVEGFVTARGYTFRKGLWWKDGLSYTRAKVYFTNYGYDRYGCRYAYNDWRVDYYPYVAPYVAPAVPKLVYSPDWKTDALKTLAKRDDLVAYQNTVNALNSTSIQPTYSTVSSGYAGTPYGVVSGQTLYARGGYNAFTQSLYSTTDINLANMLAGRLTQNAQQLAGQAHGDFTALIGQQSEAAGQIAKIQALAAAVQPPAVSNSTSFQFQNGVQSVAPTVAPIAPQSPQAPLMPRATDGNADALGAVWGESCASCHSGAQAKGGFTLDAYRAMTRQQRIDKVWARLTTEDTAKLMPRGKDGVGHRLPDAKLQVFFDDISRLKVQ